MAADFDTITAIYRFFGNGDESRWDSINTQLNAGKDALDALTGGGTTELGTSSVVYLNAGGGASDSNDGRTFGRAKATLAGAVAALPSGVGRIVVGLGTFPSTNGVIKPNLIIEGLGEGLSVFQLPNGAAAGAAVLKTENFDSLSLGDTAAGPSKWCLRGVTVDGNKANNPSGGNGISVYGYDYKLEGVEVKNAKGHGIASQWSSAGGATIPESNITDVVVHDNDGDGLNWNGPNDAQFSDVVIALNGGRGIYAGPKGTAGQCSNVHVWGTSHTWAYFIEATGWYLSECEGEGASVGQFFVGANDIAITGGHYFGASNAAITKGIVIGDGSHTPSGYLVMTKITNCVQGELSFGSDGAGMVIAQIYRPTGNAVVGSRSTSTRGMVSVIGGGSGSFTELAGAAVVRSGGADITGPTIVRGANNNAFVVNNGTNDVLAINTNANAAQFVNGAQFQFFNDNYGTIVASIDGNAGLIYLSSGNGSFPAYSFLGDADTGMFRQAANVVSLAAGGQEQLRCVEPGDGNVGMLVRRNVGGVLTLQQVSMGAADSGGSGFKALRVPN